MINKLVLTCQVGDILYENAEYGDTKIIKFAVNFTLFPDSKIETFNVSAYNKQYDFFKNNVRKGDMILLLGRIKSTEHEGKHGIYKTFDLIANEIYHFTQLPKSERIDDIETFAEEVNLPFE